MVKEAINIISRFIFLVLLALVSCQEPEGKKKTSNQQAEGESTEKEAQVGKKILFFGNSLTAGYGLELNQAFPALIQQKIDSLGLNYTVVNAGLSGETTASGKNRISWVLREKIDVFVLELGANDGLRGIDTQETFQNLQRIIDMVRDKNPRTVIILTGMEVPPNMGPQYSAEFRNIFKDVAEKNELALIPFLLEGVGGEQELNQADGIHPTAEGHKIVAETVWKVLKDLL